jgi:glycosyltransferase involved in cell wall biosynthesis
MEIQEGNLIMRIAADMTSLSDNLSGLERYAFCIVSEMIGLGRDRWYLIVKNDVPEVIKGLKRAYPERICLVHVSGGKLLVNQLKLPLVMSRIKADTYLFPAFPVPLLFGKALGCQRTCRRRSCRTKIYALIADTAVLDVPETMKLRSRLLFGIGYRHSVRVCESVITISHFSEKRIRKHYKNVRNIIYAPCGVSVGNEVKHKSEISDTICGGIFPDETNLNETVKYGIFPDETVSDGIIPNGAAPEGEARDGKKTDGAVLDGKAPDKTACPGKDGPDRSGTDCVHKEKIDRAEKDWIEIRKKYGLPEEYILVLSTLEPRKNIRCVFNAYAKLDSNADVPKLAVAGRKGWMVDKELAAVREKLSDRICLTGFIDEADLKAVYSHASVFVDASVYEGFGMPPLEALSNGVRHVLVSDIPAHREVLGDDAVYFRSVDENELAAKMAEMCRDNTERRSMPSCLKKYSWKKSAESVYAAICGY